MYPAIMQKTFKDQMGRQVEIAFPPKRIVSLVPSQTELLFHLGLDEEVVGITKFCVHPEAQFRRKQRVGGTKQVKFERIHELQPDLIIGNKEENEKEQIEKLAAEYPVWMSDIHGLSDALDMIVEVGKLVNRAAQAMALRQAIEDRFSTLSKKVTSKDRRSCAYFIWRKPYMVAAGNTFINEMLDLAGFDNVFASLDRYPEVNADQLQAVQPECLLLSSEPYPFKDQHLEEFREICPHAVIRLVDGELFSWYGSRLLHAPAYFANLREELGGD